MAHYAEVDKNNIVVNVIVGREESDGVDWETYYTRSMGDPIRGTRFLRTSYNTSGGRHKEGKEPLRKNYAGIGDTYDSVRDAFYGPQPYKSWILNETTCWWEAPVPAPSDFLDANNQPRYYWDESSVSWKLKV